MNDSTPELRLQNYLRDPAEPEIWISLDSEQPFELRGKLMGPRCVYATTVEVAYPLRPFSRLPAGLPDKSMRVVIPEASFWEPTCPFLYAGRIEVLDAGNVVAQLDVSHGIYHLSQVPAGLRLNGKPFAIQGIEIDSVPDAPTAQEWRSRGINTLVSSSLDEAIWNLADRVGFFVLGKVFDRSAELDTLWHHASCLGWIASLDVTSDLLLQNRTRSGKLLGLELGEQFRSKVPASTSFVYGAPAIIEQLSSSTLPHLAHTTNSTQCSGTGQIGWVVDSVT